MLSFDEWLERTDYSPMLWKYNNAIGIWTTNRECFILILSRSPLWSDCRTTIGHFLSRERERAVSCVSCVLYPPGASRDGTKYQNKVNIQKDGTKMRPDRRMPVQATCLTEALVTFRSESIMNSRHSAEQRYLPWYRRLPLSSHYLIPNSLSDISMQSSLQ